ncbi:MAG: phosphoethanolamine transferase, partial [Muribaculaceae bacterium]|nr:phosphoethanolamine transferase [Muribaculaceae bacterium]
ETARGENWQLGGYPRPNNPRLSLEENVVFCPRAITESNTTHKSVPMIMSFASAENFDSICHYKSIITAMKEAGFHTSFFSNQAPNRSFTEYFGNEADNVIYTVPTAAGRHPYDTALLPMLRKAVADTIHKKKFIVLHTYGSHFMYRDRYPRDSAKFLPDDATEASASHRDNLMNAYDNTILFTDAFLAEAIAILRQSGVPAAMLYSADHGEDIFDDKRERFLHASPTPTYHQLHVGMLVWLSEPLAEKHPQFMQNLRINASHGVSPQKSMFNTAMELAGISTPRFNASQSLANKSYRYNAPLYLTDLNVAVPLAESGIKAIDKDNIQKLLTR